MWILLFGLAHAQAPGNGPTTSEALRVLSQQWTSVSAVRFDDEATPRVATDLTLDQGPVTVEIESAWVVPLYIGYTDDEWTEWNDKERKRAELEDDPLTAVTEPLEPPQGRARPRWGCARAVPKGPQGLGSIQPRSPDG